MEVSQMLFIRYYECIYRSGIADSSASVHNEISNTDEKFSCIYCKPVGSGCIQYIGSEKLIKVIADAKTQQIKKNKGNKNKKKAA